MRSSVEDGCAGWKKEGKKEKQAPPLIGIGGLSRRPSGGAAAAAADERFMKFIFNINPRIQANRANCYTNCTNFNYKYVLQLAAPGAHTGSSLSRPSGALVARSNSPGVRLPGACCVLFEFLVEHRQKGPGGGEPRFVGVPVSRSYIDVFNSRR